MESRASVIQEKIAARYEMLGSYNLRSIISSGTLASVTGSARYVCIIRKVWIKFETCFFFFVMWK